MESLKRESSGAIEHCLDAGGWMVLLKTSHDAPGEFRTAVEQHLEVVCLAGPVSSPSQTRGGSQAESLR